MIAPTDRSQSGLLSLVAGVGEAITRGGLLSASTLEELQLRLITAGFRGRNALTAFIGAKLLALGGLPPLCWIAVSRTAWSPRSASRRLPVSGVVGLLLPDYVVRTLHKRHLKAVERGLPDALDMLVICSEAGLGLEPPSIG